MTSELRVDALKNIDGESVATFASDGEVTLPNQPAFLMERTTDVTGTANANSYITYDTSKYDIGSNASTSTGLFTAPVAGVYIFTSMFAVGGGDGADDSFGLGFRVNSNSDYYNITPTNANSFRINPRHLTRSGVENTYTFTEIHRLQANATVGFYITDWDYASTVLEHATFSGAKVG